MHKTSKQDYSFKRLKVCVSELRSVQSSKVKAAAFDRQAMRVVEQQPRFNCSDERWHMITVLRSQRSPRWTTTSHVSRSMRRRAIRATT